MDQSGQWNYLVPERTVTNLRYANSDSAPVGRSQHTVTALLLRRAAITHTKLAAACAALGVRTSEAGEEEGGQGRGRAPSKGKGKGVEEEKEKGKEKERASSRQPSLRDEGASGGNGYAIEPPPPAVSARTYAEPGRE